MFATHYERLVRYLQTFPQARAVTLFGAQGDGEPKEGYHEEEIQSGISAAFAAGLPERLILSATHNAAALGRLSLASEHGHAAILRRAGTRRLAIKVRSRSLFVSSHFADCSNGGQASAIDNFAG